MLEEKCSYFHTRPLTYEIRVSWDELVLQGRFRKLPEQKMSCQMLFFSFAFGLRLNTTVPPYATTVSQNWLCWQLIVKANNRFPTTTELPETDALSLKSVNQ